MTTLKRQTDLPVDEMREQKLSKLDTAEAPLINKARLRD